MPVRVKICGITTVEDAHLAADAGADAIGLICAPSPRQIGEEAAAEIAASLPPFVTPVAVFVDESVDEIVRICTAAGVGVVQLSGDESRDNVAYLREKGYRVIKTVHLPPQGAAESADALGADAVLLDTAVTGLKGGTGVLFDGDAAKNLQFSLPVIVAGGLTCENVADRIAALTPYGVDVSSGVESSPGRKDAERVRRFVENAKKAL